VAELDSPRIVVCDAGPLIHLDELGCFDLLSRFRDVLVPDAVWNEVARHRPSALRRRRVKLNRVLVSSTAADYLREHADAAPRRVTHLYIGDGYSIDSTNHYP
jgi:predicted nucleic acid-binding protein